MLERLAAVLDDAVRAIRHGHQLAALPEIVRARFFGVQVFAGLNGPDAHQRVPVIRARHRNRVDGFVFEQLARVDVGLGLGKTHLLHIAQALRDDILIHIANRRDLHVGMRGDLFDMVVAAAANSDHCHANPIVRAHHSIGLKHGGNAGAGLQKISTIEHGFHI